MGSERWSERQARIRLRRALAATTRAIGHIRIADDLVGEETGGHIAMLLLQANTLRDRLSEVESRPWQVPGEATAKQVVGEAQDGCL